MAVGAVVQRPSSHEGRISLAASQCRRAVLSFYVGSAHSTVVRHVGRTPSQTSQQVRVERSSVCAQIANGSPELRGTAMDSGGTVLQHDLPAVHAMRIPCARCPMRACCRRIPIHAASREGGRPTSQALTGVPASDNVRGWRGSIPLGVLPSGPSSSASSSKMVCALPSNSRTLASHRALSACPSRSCCPSDEWCMGSRMHRPSPRPPPPPSPTPPPPAPFPTLSPLPCPCICGCACGDVDGRV